MVMVLECFVFNALPENSNIVRTLITIYILPTYGVKQQGIVSLNLLIIHVPRHMSHSWAKWQKPAKKLIEKFVKLTDHTYACNSLTNFSIQSTTKRNQSERLCKERVMMARVCWKRFVKSLYTIYFRGVLAIYSLKPEIM